MSIAPMNISKAGGQTVASDLLTMFSSVDAALCDTARLASSIMETSQASTIPPARLQPALDAMASGFTKMVESRKDLIATHRTLAVLKSKSDIDVYDFGCGRILADAIFNANPDTVSA